MPKQVRDKQPESKEAKASTVNGYSGLKAWIDEATYYPTVQEWYSKCLGDQIIAFHLDYIKRHL